MKVVLCLGLLFGLSFTGCGANGGNPSSTAQLPAVSSIQVSPSVVSVSVGASQQFTATAHLSDGSTKDVTNTAQWNSSDSNTAGITASGLSTGVLSGTVTVTAKSGNLQAAATLTVTAAAANLVSLSISPASSSMPVHTSQQFTATGTYNDGSSADLTAFVSWSSAAPGTASINSAGVVTSVAAGSTNISASLAGISQSTGLTVTAPVIVSISITPVDLTLGIGINQQFIVTATYSDGSSSDLASGVTWTSSSPSVATVNSSGMATTINAGSTNVIAGVGALSDAETLTVVPAHLTSVTVTPAVQSIALGTVQQFNAIGAFDDGSTQLLTSASWSSSSTGAAIVDSTGFARSVGLGSTTIKATSGSVIGSASLTVTSAALVSIAVTPTSSTMAVGTTKQFAAIGTFSDSTTQDVSASVVWTSSNPSTAAIDSKGLVTSAASGSTTVKASFGSISGSVGLTVSTAQLVSITVNPANARIIKGTSIKYTAIGTFSDGSVATNLSGISWKSSKPSVASIRSFGLAHGKKSGTVSISASSLGISGSTNLTVSTGTLISLAITPVAPTASQGGTQQFTATGTFSDGSTQDITFNSHWSSSASSIATIANAPSAAPGLAQCLGIGVSTIGATSGGITGSGVLTVQ